MFEKIGLSFYPWLSFEMFLHKVIVIVSRSFLSRLHSCYPFFLDILNEFVQKRFTLGNLDRYKPASRLLLDETLH